MIDLHMHTTYSDGTENCETVLKKCQQKKLDYISITDHNNALVYEELENTKVREFYKGNIIPGVELNTKILNIPIEILGYGIDYKTMNKLIKEIYIPASERNLIEIKRLYEKCIKYGIKLSNDCLATYSSDIFASVFLHKEITKHQENKKLISNEAWKSSKIFYRQYMSDPKTPLYVEMDDFVPNFEVASNLVKKCGGLVFLPHIYEYKDNADIILNFILDNYKIDGIECYYTTFTEKQHSTILNICKENNLFVSGGSDFHGKYKPDVEIGAGYGNLQIPTDILSNWIDKVKMI
jgi:predicted metal-dependent phosphoesterase TrpH